MQNDKPHLLLVDDHPENLVALEAVLGSLDVELIAVTSGNEALKAALRYDFSVALLDVQMPGMDGFELAELLRSNKRTANIPVMFISAVFTDSDYVFRGYEKGALSFITKPFQPEILVYKVKFFIEKHEQEKVLHQLNDDLRQKNTELEALNKEMESFSYSVSHDLRAPLRAINGYAQMLEEDCYDQLDDEGKRYLGLVRDNASRMGLLIDSLLEFSRLGKKAIVKSRVDMNSLANSVLQEIKLSQPHRARVVIDELLPVNADLQLIHQVLVNLLTNAIKYSSKKEEPLVEMRSFKQNGNIVYEIRDNGAGFDNNYKNKLFGIFQRLHGADEFEGTGVGLALVKRIIIKHGGEIWAEGEVNKGATFSFSLPAE